MSGNRFAIVDELGWTDNYYVLSHEICWRGSMKRFRWFTNTSWWEKDSPDKADLMGSPKKCSPFSKIFIIIIIIFLLNLWIIWLTNWITQILNRIQKSYINVFEIKHCYINGLTRLFPFHIIIIPLLFQKSLSLFFLIVIIILFFHDFYNNNNNIAYACLLQMKTKQQ